MLTVAVLGRVEAVRDGVPARIPAGLTTELLVRLALDVGHAVRAERLVEDLWPDPLTVRANTLQAKISQLRRALGHPTAITVGPAGYTLAVEPDGVDVFEALRLAQAGAALLLDGDAEGAGATCRAGLALFGTEVLPAAGSGQWVLPHRVRLEETRLRLVEDELTARLALGATGDVVAELESLVAVNPLRERLWTSLITALYRAGRQSDALSAYQRVKALLGEELGVEPGPPLRALELQVLAHDRALAPDIETRRGNLPARTTPLIGRAADVDARLQDLGAHRLVTIVGPSGVGKTRLAIEVARLARVADGAWLVRLEGARTAGEVQAALSEALPGSDGLEGLRGAELLLVLDNCEHLVEVVAERVGALLDAAPGVGVLATSQRPLGLDGEAVRVLAPLPESDAVELFTQRALARRPSFSLTEDTAPALVELCRSLDCLPLAIELAAARARILSVPEIARRLDDRFVLLADPTSGRPERRRTLAAALSWSYELLFPDDQRGLWALSPFPAGATMPALEHTLAALGVPAAAALDVVERLVDRSLLTVDPNAPGPTRYWLLDSVRAFAAARAEEAGVADVVADALVSWVDTTAGEARDGVRGPGQAAVVAVTAGERATIDAALDRTRVHDPAAGLRIAVGFAWGWVLLDDAAAAARLRTARIAATERGESDGAGSWGTDHLLALLLESWLEAMSGDPRRARVALDGAIRLAGDDRETKELVDWHGAFVQLQESRPAAALHALQRCGTAYAARAMAWEEGASLLLAAFCHLALGDGPGARTACEQAIRLLTPLGDMWGLVHAEGVLGGIAQAEGRCSDAVRHHANAAESAEHLGFGGSAALHLTNLGRAQHRSNDPAATATLRRAITGAELAGDLRQLAITRVALAELLLSAGHRPAARSLLRAATRWYAASGAGDGAGRAVDLLTAMDAEGET